MSSLIIAQDAVSVPGALATLTLDTRGATVIYIFAYAVFGVGEPSGGFDSEGNTWFEMANEFSTCNGGLNGYRVFNPNTSATHNFRVQGNTIGGTQLIVMAFLPTFSGDFYILRRTVSNVNPIKPGSLTPPDNNYVLVTAALAGCGLTAPTVDSGFSITETLPNISVATEVLATPSLIDVIWTGLTAVPGQPNPTGGAIIEGFGIFDGTPPPPPGFSKCHVYES